MRQARQTRYLASELTLSFLRQKGGEIPIWRILSHSDHENSCTRAPHFPPAKIWVGKEEKPLSFKGIVPFILYTYAYIREREGGAHLSFWLSQKRRLNPWPPRLASASSFPSVKMCSNDFPVHAKRDMDNHEYWCRSDEFHGIRLTANWTCIHDLELLR